MPGSHRDPYSSTDPLEPLYRELKEAKARISQLENKSIPTVPSYDPGNFPQDSVEGQIAVSSLDLGQGGANHYVDGEWWGVWHDGTLLSPWTNVGSPYHPFQYMKDMNGRLRLRGAVTGGTTGQPMASIPTRFVAPHTERYVIAHGLTTSVLEVTPAGLITPLS